MGALFTFNPAPGGNPTSILARVGVSFISSAQACANAEEEIPTIRISTESNREKKAEMEKEIEAIENGEVKTNGVNGGTELQPPVQAAAGEGEQDGSESPGASAPEPFSFSNKRLCERWLDNLFMVLYEVRQRLSVSLIRTRLNV